MLGSMVEVDRFEGWLACPDCERDLDPVAAGVLGCSSGHRFETNRRGHLGLVARGWRLPADPSGRDVAAHGTSTVAPVIAAMLPRRGRVLEIAPTGPDLQIAMLSAGGALIPAAMSSSTRALDRIVSETGSGAVLADPARRWPIRDGALAALIVTGASLAPIEFHRVLAPGGFLLSASPDEDGAQLMDDLYPWFEHDQSRPNPAGEWTAVRLRRRRRMLSW